MTAAPRQARALLAVVLTAMLAGTTASAQQARLTEWVESNPFNMQNKIALGYPPPIPVNSPLPFDGFRSYDALHMRHQDLALSTRWVHPHSIGSTRNGRVIWGYRLGDEDLLTPSGLPEQATLTNGGIHAREWQSPEVVTGIIELMATAPPDAHLFDFLREQVNMVIVPVLNVDGFIQTQRYPTRNYLGTDPDFAAFWPRDGRMRRKNMLGVDENLATVFDHLGGVDLNRNNPPYWNGSNGGSSSSDSRSLVHHGAAAQSEPETRALDAAARLGPAARLSLYTDVHSYSQVHFWARNNNESLALQTQNVLGLFSRHHRAFPAGKWYAYSDRSQLARNSGIGSTDEYFTNQYQVPAWTLEIEPTGGQPVHAPLPGGGADYGGAGVNGHDGFILPEAQIRRVREQLAWSFATVFYRQAGPPHLQSLRVVDAHSGALVYDTAWDVVSAAARERYQHALQPLQLGRQYLLWAGFNKPMRWLEAGQVAVLPGQPNSTTSVAVEFLAGDQALDVQLGEVQFPLQPGDAPDGYLRYASDALVVPVLWPASERNRQLLSGQGGVQLGLRALDMTGTLGLDTDPSTVVSWAGRWQGYEASDGSAGESGGWDRSTTLPISAAPGGEVFTLEPGISAAWYDPATTNEGFIIEMLKGGRAAFYWFTYDGEGNQDWYVGAGRVKGNRVVVPKLLQTRGGRFQPGENPSPVVEEVVGSASFIWTGCESGRMEWQVGNRHGRQELRRTSRLMGLDCQTAAAAAEQDPGAAPTTADTPVNEDAGLSGAWFDPDRPGQGFTLEVLQNGSAVMHWFSYDNTGAPRWYFGIGRKQNGTWEFPNLSTTEGGVFGSNPPSGDAQLKRWGELSLALDLDSGTANYVSTEEGFGSGSLSVVRLTRLLRPADAAVHVVTAKTR